MHREGDCWLSDKMAQAYKELWAGLFVSCKKSSNVQDAFFWKRLQKLGTRHE